MITKRLDVISEEFPITFHEYEINRSARYLEMFSKCESSGKVGTNPMFSPPGSWVHMA